MNIVLIQNQFGRRHIVGVDPQDVDHLVNFTPDQAFDAFNGYGELASLRRYADYSMSTGDIIGINDVWHRCDAFGWTQLSIAEVQNTIADMMVGR